MEEGEESGIESRFWRPFDDLEIEEDEGTETQIHISDLLQRVPPTSAHNSVGRKLLGSSGSTIAVREERRRGRRTTREDNIGETTVREVKLLEQWEIQKVHHE